jgi:hypothetical protein
MIKSFRGVFARLILQDRQVPKGFSVNVAKVAPGNWCNSTTLLRLAT